MFAEVVAEEATVVPEECTKADNEDEEYRQAYHSDHYASIRALAGHWAGNINGANALRIWHWIQLKRREQSRMLAELTWQVARGGVHRTGVERGYT